jgi:glycosyltransferase involved in cell wall biosynthesis
LTEGLHRKGIDVTLFATKDSLTAAKLEGVVPIGTEQDKFHGSGEVEKEAVAWVEYHIANCMEQAGNFDIIHNNLNYLPLLFTPLLSTPMITTMHTGTIEFDRSPLRLAIYKRYNSQTSYISISNAARHPEVRYLDTVYHGINLSDYTFQQSPGKYLLVFGRLDHDKGVAEAIEVARLFGMKLVVAGIITDQKYFDEQISPHIDGKHVEYLGAIGGAQKQEILSGAFALLHMINFEEPFGFSVVEAMASGTPVVAMNKGSMSEIIEEGRSGFVVDTLQEAVSALEKIKLISRDECRASVEERFTQEIMVRKYIDVYEKVLASQ